MIAAIDPSAIARQVREEIKTYDYDAVIAASPGLVGNPAKPEWISAQLSEFRQALVEPYWLDVEVADDLAQPSRHERCLIVADDRKGYLAYVPSENKYTLVQQQDTRGHVSMGVDGDAVGVFLAR